MTGRSGELDLEAQERLVEGLEDPSAYDHPVQAVRRLETHISHILLAGDYAYKIKKPLDLGFLDFSSLAKRRHCCEEELRLNRRLAGDLYLAVVPITGTLEAPRVAGVGEPIEYAVKMRRFPDDALLGHHKVDAPLMERIAEVAANFHARAAPVAPSAPWGRAEAVFAPMEENFRHIRPLLADPEDVRRIERLRDWSRERLEALRPVLDERRAQGHVRECHGDMHLGNIALVDGRILIFDGIEFNPGLRWIDTMSDLAFLVMDLEHAGNTPLAWRFLDRYLERSGDYGGLRVRLFYQVYRALVRAKVTAIRMAQPDLEPRLRPKALDEYRSYVNLAERFTRAREPALILTCGVSGSGKSSVALALVQGLGAVRVRSDVERKRLLAPDAGTAPASSERSIYTPEATRITYAHLLQLADGITGCREKVVVDATFLRRSQREPFRMLAERRGLGFLILDLDAPVQVLRRRVAERLASGGDASEATPEVLEAQLAAREPLDEHERARSLHLDTAQPWSNAELLERCRRVIS